LVAQIFFARKVNHVLRCTLAGMIPLMASKKYSVLTEVFYEYRRGDFDDIIKSGSFSLIRDIPYQIGSRLLLPRITPILARQQEDGLWPGKDPIKTTYDVLSALKHIRVLESLMAEGRVKDVLETLKERTDYYSLLIKSQIFGKISPKDELAINNLIQDIKNIQLTNGSFDHTVFATAYRMEILYSLGVTSKDTVMQKAVSFLFEHLNKSWETETDVGHGQGICTSYVFSTQNRALEFQSAQKFRADIEPHKVCFCALGTMQSTYGIKILIALGLETDARVQAAMEGILSLIEQYQGLCYFEIQKKMEAMHDRYILN
jgi:hypothetical protein